MIDVEPLVTASFDRLHPTVPVDPAWGDVLARAGATPRTRRRLVVALVAAALVAGGLAATPLGANVVHGLWSFPGWLTGHPGKPASPAAQRAFERENARSWTAFPAGTKLRELIRTHGDGVAYALYGFRSGDMLCLRLVVSGATRGSSRSCAPLSDLRSRPEPALALQVDQSFGTIPGKHVRIGIDTFGAARAAASFGIAADAVRTVVLRSDDGTRKALVAGNAFLSVASRPKTGARVRRIVATVAGGRSYTLPFAQAPFDTTIGSAPTGTLHGPSHVQRVVRRGAIGWVERRENRGDPLPRGFPYALHGVTSRRLFGRLVHPDSASPNAVAVTVYHVTKAPHYTFLKAGEDVACYDVVVGRATGGGCSTLTQLFSHAPFTIGTFTHGGGDQYSLLAGLASDDVVRLRLFLGDGGVVQVPLRDNTYLVPVSRARYPFRLVGYDARGRVIGVETMRGENALPAWTKPDPHSKPRLLLRIVDTDGRPAMLYTRRSLTGGTCFSVRSRGGGSDGCLPPKWQGPPLQLGFVGDPRMTAVLEGRVRDDVTRIEIRHRSGAIETVSPTKGFVLRAVAHDDPIAEIDGYDLSGRRVGRYRPLLP